VSNEIAGAHVHNFNRNVHIITGGVDLSDFPYVPEPYLGAKNRKLIFFGGRADAHAKGFGVLLEAGERLAKARQDFEIRATHGRLETSIPWLADAGWVPHERMKEWYQRSSICVVPSIWEEPFGLVAVEAMASGRPVCVSRVGGLQAIPVHGESGYVYDRHDAGALAAHLAELLDDPAKRAAMGEAGRRRAEEVFAWDNVIERNYPPLLESIVA
jgi:glycosyltransferase involved in cell wall biosynthesis